MYVGTQCAGVGSRKYRDEHAVYPISRAQADYRCCEIARQAAELAKFYHISLFAFFDV